MTPKEAAEGRRLLDARAAIPEHEPLRRVTAGHRLQDWLWANREELVRRAELAAEPQGVPGPMQHCAKHRVFIPNGRACLACMTEPQDAPASLVREARASARLDGETHCLPDEGAPKESPHVCGHAGPGENGPRYHCHVCQSKGCKACETEAFARAKGRRECCPTCYALVPSFVITPDGERCADTWHRGAPQKPELMSEQALAVPVYECGDKTCGLCWLCTKQGNATPQKPEGA
jgi:hypothetical protein